MFNDAAPFPWLSWLVRSLASRLHVDPTQKDYGWRPDGDLGQSDESYAAALAAHYKS